MDWTPLYPALSALVASAITGGIMLFSQRLAQRNESARHARKIAYEAAVTDWKAMQSTVLRHVARRDKINSTGGDVDTTPTQLPVLEEFILHHLFLVQEANAGRLQTDHEIEEFIRLSQHRVRVMKEARKKFFDGLKQAHH